MKTFHCFLLAIIEILIFPVLNAQDITGNWYGIYSKSETDSVRVNLHIYKDNNRLKATLDCPEQEGFNIPVDEIIFKKDKIFFRCSDLGATYEGRANQDYSMIYGELIRYGYIDLLDFGRKKLERIVPVKNNLLAVIPAKVKVIKTGNPQKIDYTGVRAVESGMPKVIEIDTSEQKVLTPGKDTILNPIIYKFPEIGTKDKKNTQRSVDRWIPVFQWVKQSEPILTQPMRMKDAACLNIFYLDIEQGLRDAAIICIMEDTRGNMWFGSNSTGVCRYDGKSLTYYAAREGLTHTGNRAIMEDRSGNIWI
jgi:hypothetical protein